MFIDFKLKLASTNKSYKVILLRHENQNIKFRTLTFIVLCIYFILIWNAILLKIFNLTEGNVKNFFELSNSNVFFYHLRNVKRLKY